LPVTVSALYSTCGMGEKIFIRTFGCQMNVHDSARIMEIMRQRGFEEAASPAEAGLIVVNTCSVREKAYQKVRSAVGSMRRFRTRGQRSPVIAVAGCVARQEGRRWLEMCPHVDIVMGPDALIRVAELVRRIREGEGPIVDVDFDDGKPSDFVSPAFPPGRRSPAASITIMKGCNGACSFCIVPSVRGPERCRPPEDIVGNVRDLVGAGTKEVLLLGQTVNSWRYGEHGFADLLNMIDEVGGLARVRYTSPYPGYVTPALAEAHGSLASLCEHVHLPVQSGSNGVLARMNRKYTREDYLEAVGLLKKARPSMALSTDMIVGFPGETDKDFEQTLDLVREVEFDTMFSFKYSPRPGTGAASLDDDVPAKVKQERLEELHRLADQMTAKNWGEDLGREVEVLVEKEGRVEGQLTGRTRKNRIVNFPADPSAGVGPGDLAAVRIDEILPHSLRGRAARRA
jgi:tRNA-2-methylthio-N6-dimethylallyladenosine synthase